MKITARIRFLFLLAAIPLASAANELPINWAELPPPYHTPSKARSPLLVPRPEGAVLELPAGFKVEEYLGEFSAPRFMALGPSQELLVSDIEDGAVYVVRNGKKSRLVAGLDRPYGLAFRNEWLYVAEATSVKRYAYDAKTGKILGTGEEVIALHDFGRGHSTRTLLFDAQGEKLYLGIGSRSNIDAGEHPMRAAINRFSPDGGAHEIYASGLRNPVGLRWYPGTSELWATSVERDGLGDDLPPDFLTRVERGGFYGWPYAYIGPHADPNHKGTAPEMVKKTLYPSVLLGAHVAALDFIFYTGTAFPKKYRGGCFVALHGSWNRSKPSGYKISFIPFENGKPLAGPEDFMTGWLLSADEPRAWGRPVGILQMPDGSVLVSDDGGGRIWRVSYVTP
ncbi:MAG: PQQ-dependent sugar dehydrogenase [Gammaproteobacteria bacterium]